MDLNNGVIILMIILCIMLYMYLFKLRLEEAEGFTPKIYASINSKKRAVRRFKERFVDLSTEKWNRFLRQSELY
jgi:hypothetical protein